MMKFKKCPCCNEAPFDITKETEDGFYFRCAKCGPLYYKKWEDKNYDETNSGHDWCSVEMKEMISDDWSLKERKHSVCEYHESDIETLRQKLIEDFIKEIEKGDSLDIESFHPEETVTKIINKRFGCD